MVDNGMRNVVLLLVDEEQKKEGGQSKRVGKTEG